MKQLSLERKAVRFGLFEVDLNSQELRKSGIKIKLQDQPFQILALLLERPGEIVTREEIQKRLWAGDTFVDFDLGLNSAVKKLRQALGDESDNPRFVETLYRRGYRFLAPVQWANGSSVMADASPAPSSANGDGALAHPIRAAVEEKPAAHEGRPARKLVMVPLMLLLLGLGIWGGYSLRPPALPRITGYQEVTHDGRQKSGLVADRERLYLAEYESGRFAIAQVSAAGGETSFLASPFPNVKLANILPNGSALLVGAFQEMNKQETLWTLSLPAGAPRRMEDLVADSVAPLPDGKWLIYSNANAVYQAAVDGTHVQKLFSTKGQPSGLSVSPDSRKIVFTVSNKETGTSTLWMANRDGSDVHTIFPGGEAAGLDSAASWTPDGKFLLFQRYREGHANIWALPMSKTWLGQQPLPVQLTNGPLDFKQPLVSSDGKKIYAIGAQPRTELVRGDGKSGFKPFLGGISITDVAFSKDGQWVTYVTIPDKALWRSRVDGSDRLQLTDPSKVLAGLPRWSPDGQRIVFMGKTSSTSWRAYLISSDGGNFQALIPGATAGSDPNWMPDGKSIVLSLSNSGHSSQGVSLLDLQSGKVRDLPGAEHFFSPRPSPDGKYIAAISTDSESLVLFDIGTQHWTDLVKVPVSYPSWSRDGLYLYFYSFLSGDPAFYRLRISDHKLERVGGLSGVERFWGDLAEWVGLAPDDSFLLARDASNQEVYALDWLTK